MKWLDGSCSWEPRKNILDDRLIKDLRRDSKGLYSGVEVVHTRRKGAKLEYRLYFKGRPLAEDIWVAEKHVDPGLIETQNLGK